MVLYFSATGNTRYIAEIIAKKLHDDALDLTDRIKRSDHSLIRSKKPFVVCCPIYICDIPVFFSQFLRKLKLAGNRKIYFVFTSGSSYEGTAGWRAGKIAVRKHMTYMGCADVVMPRNYVASSLSFSNDEKEIHFLLENAVYESEKIANTIRYSRKLKTRHVFIAEKALILPFVPLWVKYMQPSAPFHTTDKCMGCGKCAEVCPINNIEIKDKKPVWIAPCAHCMACICNCPAEAIEFGDITQNKVRYNIRKYLKK